MNTQHKLKDLPAILYKYLKLLALISGFVALGLVLYFIIFVSKGFYHADCADTILWAQATVDGKAIMNPDFYYAAILPFGGQLIMVPFVAIFGYGMLAQIIGMTIFALLLTFAIVYFCKSIDFNCRWISLTVAFMLLIFSSSEKLREIFWCHIIYYSLGALFLLIGLGLVFNLLKRETLSKKHYILLFIWSSLCSINGSQSFTLYTLPVIGALFAERFFDLNTPLLSKKNKREWLIILNLATSIVVGLILAKIINQGITSDYQNLYSSFDSPDNWTQNIGSLLPSILSLCGARPTSTIALFSPQGILLLIRIIGILIIVITPFIMLALYKKITNKIYRITLFAHIFITCFILLAWTFGKLNSAAWRLSPILVTGSLLTFIFIKWIIGQKEYSRLAAFLSIPAFFMIISFISELSYTFIDNQTEDNRKFIAIGEYLENEGLEYGYATFWNSNIITLLTDSKVKTICVHKDGNNLYLSDYQVNKNWYHDNRYSTYFLLLTNDEYLSYKKSSEYEEPQEIKYHLDYSILIYDHNIMTSKSYYPTGIIGFD